MGPPPLPSVVGTDGVGRLGDGRRVYFDVDRRAVRLDGRARARAGGRAVRRRRRRSTTRPRRRSATPGLGAWLARRVALAAAAGRDRARARARPARSAASRCRRRSCSARAAWSRRRGRTSGWPGCCERGADAIVELDGGDLTAAIKDAAGGAVDVTIDTLWGEPALAAIGAAARCARHVQVGQLAGVDMTLAGAGRALGLARPLRLLRRAPADRRPARGLPAPDDARRARRDRRRRRALPARAGRHGLGAPAAGDRRRRSWYSSHDKEGSR